MPNPELLNLLWQDRTRCAVKTVCSLANEFGVEVSLQEATRFIEERKTVTDAFEATSTSYGLEWELTVIQKLLGIAAENHGKSIPSLEKLTFHSLEDLLDFQQQGEIVLFIDPHKNHPEAHVFHLGKKKQYSASGELAKISNEFEEFDVPVLLNAISHNSVHAFIAVGN